MGCWLGAVGWGAVLALSHPTVVWEPSLGSANSALAVEHLADTIRTAYRHSKLDLAILVASADRKAVVHTILI